MRKRSFLAIFLGALGIIILGGRAYFDTMGREIHRISDSTFHDVRLIQDFETNAVYTYLVFPSGEAENTYDEGLAHYVEHLAWLSFLGGSQDKRQRHSNASTNQFSTGYWQQTTSDELHETLQKLSTLAKPLKPETDFALEERRIVLREYDFRFAERPLYPVFREMDQTLYGPGTLARSVIGEPSVIAKYSLKDAIELHHKSHVLSQATLLVYGNVSRSQLQSALASVKSDAKPSTGKAKAGTSWVEDRPLKEGASLSLATLSEDTFLYRKLVPLVACETPSHCAILAKIAENAVDSTLPGGLAGPLRFDQFVARSFGFNIRLIGNKYVEMSFIANPDTGVSLETLEAEFHSALQETLENGLPPETFERVSSRLENQLHGILKRDHPSYNRDLALDQLMSGRSIFSVSDQINAVEKIQLRDVDDFLKSLTFDGREVTRRVSAQG